MTIFEVIKNDHKVIKKLLNELIHLGHHSEMDFQRLKIKWLSHMYVEEELAYSRILERNAEEIETVEAKEEHHLMEVLLSELEESTIPDIEWAAKLMVLQENLELHLQREELHLFKRLRAILPKEEQEKLGKEMLEKMEALELEWKSELEGHYIGQSA